MVIMYNFYYFNPWQNPYPPHLWLVTCGLRVWVWSAQKYLQVTCATPLYVGSGPLPTYRYIMWLHKGMLEWFVLHNALMATRWHSACGIKYYQRDCLQKTLVAVKYHNSTMIQVGNSDSNSTTQNSTWIVESSLEVIQHSESWFTCRRFTLPHFITCNFNYLYLIYN